jgi:uncharacterized protein (DUF983 family)
MPMTEEHIPRGYLSTIIGCYCPRCREGKLFRHPTSIRLGRNMDMYEYCVVCGQPTDIEVGFYYGTGYVSYVIALGITIFYLLFWWLIIGFSFHDHRFFYALGTNAVLLLVLQAWLMRFSRSLWISWFVSYDPNWKDHPPEQNERTNPDQMHNW